MEISDEEIERARQAWVVADCLEYKAAKAWYDSVRKQMHFQLATGITISFSPSIFEELRQASDDELSDFHLSGEGKSIHWEKLNVDLSVHSILSNTLNNN